MSNIIQIKNVRAYLDENGTAQLSLEDVARGLGITRIAASGNDVIRWERVEKYLAEFGFVPTSGHDGFIPENIFYLLAMKANNETAKKFQMQVANEILPSIRKHGAYMTGETLEKALTSPDFLIQLASKLKEEQQARIEAEQKLAIAAPKAENWETVAEDEGFLMTANELAKTIAYPGLTATKVRECLKQIGVLCKEKNELTADALRRGYGRHIVETINIGHREKVVTVPKFRGKVIDIVLPYWKRTAGRLW